MNFAVCKCLMAFRNNFFPRSVKQKKMTCISMKISGKIDHLILNYSNEKVKLFVCLNKHYSELAGTYVVELQKSAVSR